jgi:hypothetical protein
MTEFFALLVCTVLNHLLQLPEAWEAVIHVIHDIKIGCKLTKYPFESISTNLGAWQSQFRANGLKSGGCHAHINVVLTEETINASNM